jgi:phospholipase C
MTSLRILLLASAMSAAALVPAHAQDALAKIGHIVVIFEENRSFDNMFGLFPGADGLLNAGSAMPQVDKNGRVYEVLPSVINTNVKPPANDARFPLQMPNGPFPIETFVSQEETTGDLWHRWYQEQMQIDGGRMDKFAAFSDAAGLSMGYFDMSRSHEWKLASEYTLGDAMFHSAFGGSFLNHAFLVCSCAFRWPNAPAKIVAQEDPWGNMTKDGQVTPDGYAVNTSRSVYIHAPGDTDEPLLVPPQTVPHIGDRLDAKNVTWAWYSGGYDDAMRGKPDRLFQFHHQPLAYFQDLAPGTPGQKAHLKDYNDLVDDLDHNTLPQVVFYKPIGEFNEHPGYANIADGDAHLAAVVAKLQASSAWSDMLILVTYDENGGQWDHVPPPHRDRWGPGSRVPLIAIGPTVKRHFIDHTTYDFGSILRTIEVRFGADPVGAPDANANPMTNLLQ